jgi:hypothetical protein
MPADKSLPGTLKRSPKKAQETWLKTHDSAVEQYGDGERAHRTAFKSLKNSFEKVDHYGHTRAELYDRAKALGIEGRSKMDKLELAREIGRRQG